MSITLLVGLVVAMGLAAMLYASVGHGGASAYLAIMALADMAPAVMRPTALALNLVVAGIAFAAFARAGHFDRRLFLLAAVPAVPLAFVGGQIALDDAIYRPLVGVVLLVAAAQFAWQPDARRSAQPRPMLVMIAGAALGFLAGLTGTGGGIFLSPLLLVTGWATPRTTAAVSAAFILVNSAAGLAGNLALVGALPNETPWLMGAVALGGLAGARLGAVMVSRATLMRLLAAVLVVAGGKLVLT